MGVQVLPSFQTPPARSGLHLVVQQPTTSMERFSLEIPRYASIELAEKSNPLGCVRGIVIALGIQAAVALAAFGLWELHFLFH